MDSGAVRRLTLANALSLAQEISDGGLIAIRAAVSAVGKANEEAENAAYASVLETRGRAKALHAFQEKLLITTILGEIRVSLYASLDEACIASHVESV